MTDRSEAALVHLRGAQMVLDGLRKTPTAEQVTAIRTMVGDAVSVLQEPDPQKQRLAFVILAIKQSIEMYHPMVRGKRMTRVRVIDQTLYHWALEQIHSEGFGT